MDGTVSMSLAAIDQLRNEKLEAERRVLELESVQKQIKVELTVKEIYSYTDTEVASHTRYGMTYQAVNRNGTSIIHTDVKFLGLEEIKQDFVLDAQNQVQEDITKLNNHINDLNEQIRKAETKYGTLLNSKKDKEEELTRNYRAKQRQLEEQHLKDLDTLNNIIRELRQEEVEKTKDQKIAKLEAELAKEKAKRWWQKL